MLEILLVRHGMTRGNLQKRYVGRTDEPVLPEALEQLAASDRITMQPQAIYTSPLLRCRQTAEALFYRNCDKADMSVLSFRQGNQSADLKSTNSAADMQTTDEKDWNMQSERHQRNSKVNLQDHSGIPWEIIVPDLIETDFGAFEYKTYEDLNGDPAYQAWIDSGGMTAFPGGESGADFRARACHAFAWCLQDARKKNYSRIAVVTHGGVIMAAMERYARPEASFYSWQVRNGCGFLLREREDGYFEAERYVPYFRQKRITSKPDMGSFEKL